MMPKYIVIVDLQSQIKVMLLSLPYSHNLFFICGYNNIGQC